MRLLNNFSNVLLQIPPEITAALEPIKDNDEAVKAYGIHLGTEMCKKILANGITTLHMYTLNMEKLALAILMVIYWHPISVLSIFQLLSKFPLSLLFSFSESWIN